MNIHEALATGNFGLPKGRKVSVRLGALEAIMLSKLSSQLDCTTSDAIAAGIRVLYARQNPEPNAVAERELEPAT